MQGLFVEERIVISQLNKYKSNLEWNKFYCVTYLFFIISYIGNKSLNEGFSADYT